MPVPVEDEWNVLGRDTRAGVGHGQDDVGLVRRTENPHMAARRRELECVAQQVADGLQQALRVRVYPGQRLREIEVQDDALLLRHRLEQLHRSRGEEYRVDRATLQREAA